MSRRSRILIGKAGLDKHDRGAIIIAQALRNAGHEIVYVGPGHTPEEVARIAADEDVDAIGLSLLSGAHLDLFGELVKELAEIDATDIVLFAGGTIPDEDIRALQALGIHGVFTPGTPLHQVVAAVSEALSGTAAGADA